MFRQCSDIPSVIASVGGPVFDEELRTGELLYARCDNHTWMNATSPLTDNPNFAVTGTDGMFTINNLPASKQTGQGVHEVTGTQARHSARRADGDHHRFTLSNAEQ